MMNDNLKYVDVLLPLKLKRNITYSLPYDKDNGVRRGSWILVRLLGRKYLAVVEKVYSTAPYFDINKIRDIEATVDLKPVAETQFGFWKAIAEYYMCSTGEVFKAAYPRLLLNQIDKKRIVNRKPKEFKCAPVPQLSEEQQNVLEKIKKTFSDKKPALLNGITGSGKTEIFINLANTTLEQGKQVLYLVPEIAISREIQGRLETVFGDKLVVWHSKQGPSVKKRIFDLLSLDENPKVILGTRSSVLLPLNNLGLIIVDEEHDSSYKQSDPAPRYNGRDAALILASMIGANVIMGSGTPSLDSLYNVKIGKYGGIDLTRRYYDTKDPEIIIVDSNKARRLHDMNGSLSMRLVNMIDATLKKGEQVLVFRSRKAYSSFLQCEECGTVLKCPRCNVSLSYRKSSNIMTCYYCGYHIPFSGKCPECGSESIRCIGSGTEKIEEELKTLFPDARIARLDSDIAESVKAEKAVLKEFREGTIDILVGTQMITKGFDFANLSLVAVISADALLSLQDFRADEKALQLFRQVMGRTGRRDRQGTIVIQTAQPEHPVYKRFISNDTKREEELQEREKFRFPPFVRLITITVKDRYEGRLARISRMIDKELPLIGFKDLTGPVVPQVDKIQGQFINIFWIKLPRNNQSKLLKAKLSTKIDEICSAMKPSPEIIIDVDPL